MAKEKNPEGDLDRDDYDDGDEIIENGSKGPGRGTPLRKLPQHSLYTTFCGPIDSAGRAIPPRTEAEAEEWRRGKDKLRQIALWAIRHVRVDGLEDDTLQTIMFSFARCAIAPKTKKKDALKMATTVAKRWALEEKRSMFYAVHLDRKDHFDKACRDQCVRADTDLGMDEDAADPLRHDDFVDGLDATVDGDNIDWANIPAEMSTAINGAFREVHPRVTRVMRHVLMGESIGRAAELEAVAYQTAVTHMRTFMQAAQSRL